MHVNGAGLDFFRRSRLHVTESVPPIESHGRHATRNLRRNANDRTLYTATFAAKLLIAVTRRAEVIGSTKPLVQ